MECREKKNRFFIVAAVSVLLYLCFTLINGCINEKTPEIIVNVDACVQCNMVITQLNQACGYMGENEFIVFDSPSCLLKGYEKIKKQGIELPETIYFTDYTTNKFVISDSTYFLHTKHIPTVMNAGVLCFNLKETAESFIKFSDEIITDWKGYQVISGTPDRIIEVTISPESMNPGVVQIYKDELVEWKFLARDIKRKYVIYLKGYEELGEIILSENKKTVTFRMLADKPGAGFPFIFADGEVPIGMVKVVGAHTSDEEAM
jgi:hypothetical protein